MPKFDFILEEIQRHSLDMRQFIDFRQSILPNGMRIIEAYNSSGLTFTILPDRGLDIWSAHYNGIPLTWIAPGSPFPPDFGQSWLRQFNGGLLTTCGLSNVGPPETDSITGEQRDLHGLYTRLRATDVDVYFEGRGETQNAYPVTLSATIYESSLFGEQLQLKRLYGLELGKPTIHIHDTIYNLGDKPVPMMLLYHFNFGYPLVQAGAQLVTPHAAVYPRDARAKEGFDRWAEYDAAAPEYAEQVYFHHLKEDTEESLTTVMLGHDDFAVVLEWDTLNLPYLTQWKNTRQGIYVCGVEPGNCLPMGRNHARESGRLISLEPGEHEYFNVSLTVRDGAEAVQRSRARIDHIRDNGRTISGVRFDEFTI